MKTLAITLSEHESEVLRRTYNDRMNGDKSSPDDIAILDEITSRLMKEWDGIPSTAAEDHRRAAIIKLAHDRHARDGELEFDDNALVSEGNDNGAYVQGWRWVDFEGTEFDKEKETANSEPQ